ncbi:MULTISPECIES: Sec-independent protein translocase subunit TatA [Streptomyces]|uniref:Sec-independent protein translocase protein TatA n=1 Tax=Streptomyces camelliae TaxID=3004093 RepID=A0ABY7PFS2_9ACTN|nr:MULTISPECIES: Sec-independent protein translocase subunit TatA [unclassified Streptomyces]WBO68417.1 Sec-independent protein translocase subunit TatA [Streptomyces sp. HUAS 2-6]
MLRNGLEPWHLLIVAIVIILVFGSKKLPEAARGLGKSLRILKSEAAAMKEDAPTPSPARAQDTTDTPASAPRLTPVASEAPETTAPVTENRAAH